MIGRNASHVVVHRGEHGDGVLRYVHSGEDLSGLADAGKALRQELGGEVVQMLEGGGFFFCWNDQEGEWGEGKGKEGKGNGGGGGREGEGGGTIR